MQARSATCVFSTLAFVLTAFAGERRLIELEKGLAHDAV
jgi:hypothetical protein